MKVEFFLPIEPRPKRTGQMSFRNGKAVFFKNKTNRAFEKEVKSFFEYNFKNVWYSKEKPLRIKVQFNMKRPKSVKRVYHTVKSDIDNLLKNLFDSLQGILFEQDQQIIEIHAKKSYAENLENVGIHVIIEDVGLSTK